MKVMENGVLEATKLISEVRKEDQDIKEATVLQIVKKAIYHGHGFQPSHCPGEEDGNL